MPTNYYVKRQPNLSPSKRWTTTSEGALEEVAKKLEGKYDRAGMARDLEKRKLANTKTSINFGNEAVDYTSDTQENLRKALGGTNASERAAQTERIRAMKADLTTTKFCLGDEVPLYESVNHAAMGVADTFRGVGRVAMNKDVMAAVKKSSLHFGNESVVYKSTAHESMEYHGNSTNFSKLKEEVKDMTATLRKHNFTFGDAKVLYQSDYASGYGAIPLEAYRVSGEKKAGMRAIIEDSRSCHFSLGNDRPVYLSNTQQALQSIDGHTANDASKQAEHARAMKTALQRTSIVIGDDEDYY